MKILVDSDVISALSSPESKEFEIVQDFFDSVPQSSTFYLSMLTVLEVEFNIASFKKDEDRNELRAMLDIFKKNFSILNINFEAAKIYGELKHRFKQKTGINRNSLKRHNIDIALASIAIANDCVLIGQDKIYSDHLCQLDNRLQHKNWRMTFKEEHQINEPHPNYPQHPHQPPMAQPNSPHWSSTQSL